MTRRAVILCERSGRVRDALAARGWDAWSCDLEPAESGGQHIQGDALAVVRMGWDLAIAHPPCTYLASSGLHWNTRRPERATLTEQALGFVFTLRDLLTAHVARWGIENPIGCLSSRWRRPDQIIQPYQFGDDASKATCLWLHRLPPLRHTQRVDPRYSCACGQVFAFSLGLHGCPGCAGEGRVRTIWGNQTASGQNKLGPSPERATERARTYPGIANAIADQWGTYA